MRAFICAASLMPTMCFAQLKIEWQSEISDFKYDYVSGIIVNQQNVLVSTSGGVKNFTKSGIETSFSGASSGIYTMQEFKNNIYTVGYMNLERRDYEGKEISDVKLYQAENITLSARNGMIFNDNLYTTNYSRYFFKYDLAGNKIWEREIAELCDNIYLQAQGKYIYIYSLINKPALGPRLMQYDTQGNQKWSIPTGYLYAMIADKEGNCYITSANPESTVSKINPSGQVVWSKLLNGQWAQGMSIYGDSLLLCGNISLNAITDKNQSCAYSIMSASSGEILHQQVVDLYEDKNESEKMSAIATDGKAIYIGGRHSDENPRAFLLKLSKEGNTTGLKEETTNTFSVFPNPSGSKFTIRSASSISNVQITMRNALGAVVYSTTISKENGKNVEVNPGELPAGTYIVEIVSGNKKTVKKVVVE